MQSQLQWFLCHSSNTSLFQTNLKWPDRNMDGMIQIPIFLPLALLMTQFYIYHCSLHPSDSWICKALSFFLMNMLSNRGSHTLIQAVYTSWKYTVTSLKNFYVHSIKMFCNNLRPLNQFCWAILWSLCFWIHLPISLHIWYFRNLDQMKWNYSVIAATRVDIWFSRGAISCCAVL